VAWTILGEDLMESFVYHKFYVSMEFFRRSCVTAVIVLTLFTHFITVKIMMNI
jgi:hypothetical protein